MLGVADRLLVKGWSFAPSNKGWSNQQLAYQWLTQCYQPQIKPNMAERQLLIVDGHSSHLSAQFKQFRMMHVTYLIQNHCLPYSKPSLIPRKYCHAVIALAHLVASIVCLLVSIVLDILPSYSKIHHAVLDHALIVLNNV